MPETFAKKNPWEGRDARVTLKGRKTRLAMMVDMDRCIGCFSCEVSCKMQKDLPVGPRLMRVIQIGPYKIKAQGGDQFRTAYVPMNCRQCEPAPCIEVCPTGAMQRREKDGIVFVAEELCIGCKSCIAACPFGAPQLNPNTGKVIKCDYCMDRVDEGLLPACVTKCSMDALRFGDINELSTLNREKHVRMLTADLFNWTKNQI
ncbi:MAG: 4Fe-4S binding protein [Firmicutes bacterium]|jgi:DMSO reductase iron-sulfur subunit|nr:4Fe-4S binding protein [Bacillota bacterium]